MKSLLLTFSLIPIVAGIASADIGESGQISVGGPITAGSSATAHAFVTANTVESNYAIAVATGYAALDTYTESVSSAGSSGASFAVYWSSSSVIKLTLTANVTLSFQNAKPGQMITLMLQQGAGGSRTVTWPTMSWPAATAPTLTLTEGKTDFISVFYDGTTYFGFVGGQNYAP